MHSVKVPVVRRWCFTISLEHVQPNYTMIHCDIHTRWSKQVKRELRDGWYLLRMCHRGPIYALHDPADEKHEKFLKMFGFKPHSDQLWVWENGNG